MKQLVHLPGPLGYPMGNSLGINAFLTGANRGALFPELPVERLYQAFRYHPSPTEPAQPPSISYLRDGLQQEGGK